MSHMVQQMFSVREPAWHGLGKTMDRNPVDSEEGMVWAGHNHNMICQPVARMVGTESVPVVINGYKAIVREDTQQVISVMKDSYEVIQNKIPWEILDQVFKQGAKWDTAGILGGKFDERNQVVKGQVYWCMCLLDEPKAVEGDNSLTYPYLAATWSHDGVQALKFRATPVRIVCANTQHMAMYGSDGADLDISIRHFGSLDVRITKAKEAIKLARTNLNAYLEVSNELAKMPVNDAGIEKFIFRIVPMPDAKLLTDRVRGNVEKSRQQVRDLFNGSTTPSTIRNTAYGLVQVGVEYFQHCRRYMNKDVYFTRSVIHTGAATMQLVSTAREIAGMSV